MSSGILVVNLRRQPDLEVPSAGCGPPTRGYLQIFQGCWRRAISPCVRAAKSCAESACCCRVVKAGRVFRPGGRTGQTAIPAWCWPPGICTGVWHFTAFIVGDLHHMSDKETIPQPVPWEFYDENALDVIEHGIFTSIPPGEMGKTMAPYDFDHEAAGAYRSADGHEVGIARLHLQPIDGQGRQHQCLSPRLESS